MAKSKRQVKRRSNTSPRQPGLGKIATVFACGTALFSDGYVNSASGPVNYILRKLYPNEYAGTNASQLFTSLVFAGTILGMLSFGYISDRVGRRPGMIFGSLWMALFALLSGLAYGKSAAVMIRCLIAYRFLIGIAIGAEYPAGSVAAAENTEDSGVKKSQQNLLFVLATDTALDLGFVLSSFIAYLLFQIFGEADIEWVWRLTLGLGAVFPLVVLYFRMQMREPEHYEKNSMREVGFLKIPWGIILRHYGIRLLAISLAWFLYDFAYPGSIYSSVIVQEAIGSDAPYSQVLGWDTLINCFYLPGTIAGALIVDKLGPKYTMILGLLLQAFTGFILAGCFELIKRHVAALSVVYGLYLSFGELGPGDCLGLLASKASGPTAVRGIFYGIAAAVGKIGAFIATYVYTPIIDDLGGTGTFGGDSGPVFIGSGMALLSALIIFLAIPNFGADFMLEEDIRFRHILEESGFDTANMGVKALLEADYIDDTASVVPFSDAKSKTQSNRSRKAKRDVTVTEKASDL